MMLFPWLLYLIFYAYWLYDKKPHKRVRTYELFKLQLTIDSKQW